MAYIEDEDKLLLSRANDALRIAEDKYVLKTLGFLNPAQRMYIKENLYVPKDMVVEFEGGYCDAERTVMVCRPEFLEVEGDQYLSVIECSGKYIQNLSHRDYLGSLMGLGLTRESIGDILVMEDKTLIFTKPENADYIIQNLTKIGRVGIDIKRCLLAETVVPPKKTIEVSGTVASLRLDSVLAVGTRLARGKAVELIKAGQVAVNWKIAQETDQQVKEGDIFSIRGYGRMTLLKIGCLSNKGRYHITIARYM